MTYDVTDTEGRVIYCGHDCELACDIHDHEPGAHMGFREDDTPRSTE